MKTDLSKAVFVVTYFPYGVKPKTDPQKLRSIKFLTQAPKLQYSSASRAYILFPGYRSAFMKFPSHGHAMQQEHFRSAA